jgi:hypothetical protein
MTRRWSVSRPAAGPTAAPPPATAAYTPNARLRARSSGKLVVISASAVGAITAPASTLDRPRGKQPLLAGGEPAEQGRRGEQQQPEDEQPPAAKNVTGAATEQEQAAEGDRVGVHHPLQAGAGEAKRTLHMRQRDIDDGAVHARGTIVILSMGGSGAFVDLSTSDKAETCRASICTICDQVGGFDGLDMNLETTSAAFHPEVYENNMVWLAQQLTAQYGVKFAITVPASGDIYAPYLSHDVRIVQALHASGVLDWCAPQIYDGFEADNESQKANVAATTGPTSWTVTRQRSASVTPPWKPAATRCPRPESDGRVEVFTSYNRLCNAYPEIRGVFHFDARADYNQAWKFATTLALRVAKGILFAPVTPPIGLTDDFSSNTHWTFAGGAVITGGKIVVHPLAYGITPPVHGDHHTSSYNLESGHLQHRLEGIPLR